MLDLLFPCYCQGCGELGVPLCACCKKYIVSCNAQERRVAKLAAMDRFGEDFDEVFAVGLCEDLLYELIRKYKYDCMRDLAKPLAELLAKEIKGAGFVIVPLPTIGRHIRQRGFDHIGLLAREMCKLKRFELSRMLVRANSTVQVGSSNSERIIQAESAYRLAKDAVVDEKAHYLLVDDVITTGASVKAAAEVLRAAGAKNISVAVLAIRESV